MFQTIYKTLIGYKEIEVNSRKNNIEKAFVDFIKKCNWRKKQIKLQVICGNKCGCGIPTIFQLTVTENSDLDDILEAVKKNDFTKFMKKNIANEKVLKKIDSNTFLNREVSYIFYPKANEILMSFY